MFTQLNQYHVVLEVAPQFQRNPHALDDIYMRSTTGGEVPLSAFTHFEPGTAPLAVNHQGQFPAVTISFNLAPGYSLGDAVTAIDRRAEQIGMPASIAGRVPGHRRGVPRVADERTAADSRRARHRLHRARRSVRELHPSDHDSLDAAVGGRRRDPGADDLPHGSQRDRADRHHPADRYREEERDHDDRLRARGGARAKASRRARRSTRPACCASGRS